MLTSVRHMSFTSYWMEASLYTPAGPHIARSRYSRRSCSTAKRVAPARVATPILS